MRIKANIESIEYRNSAPKYEKKVVTLLVNREQTLFVEFRGYMMSKLDSYREGDEIEIDFQFEGKTSKNSGIQYNNLVATNVIN